MEVRTILKPQYEVHVHDDCYRDRSPQEQAESLKRISRIVLASQRRRYLETQK